MKRDKYYGRINAGFQDLNPITYGYEHVPAGRVIGPTVQNNTVIHYVESGCGTLKMGGMVYQIHAGQMFIIPQSEEATYSADENDPWFYYFIAFDGRFSYDFAKLPPVITLENGSELFREINDAIVFEGGRIFRLASFLYKLHAELFADDMLRFNAYVEYVKNYIDVNFAQEIKVDELAKAVNFSRWHLLKLFKKETGQTIRQYILSVRMNHAASCLAQGKTVAQTAELCGFGSSTHFSKVFGDYWDMTPTKYKKTCKPKSR